MAEGALRVSACLDSALVECIRRSPAAQGMALVPSIRHEQVPHSFSQIKEASSKLEVPVRVLGGGYPTSYKRRIEGRYEPLTMRRSTGAGAQRSTLTSSLLMPKSQRTE